MLRPAFLATLAALPFVLTPAAAVPPAPCANTIVHEPLVLFDINGSTIGGPIDVCLTVYNDGQARLSSTGQFGLPSQAQLAFPGTQATTGLLLDLSALGAGGLCDTFSGASDVPISTLTVFRNATTPRNHTFSWDTPDGAHGPVQQRLMDFMQATFPNF